MAKKKQKKQDNKNPHAVALGELGARARTKKLSPERRKEIAQKAIQARWSKSKQPIQEQ
jgi:hypothetical protein